MHGLGWQRKHIIAKESLHFRRAVNNLRVLHAWECSSVLICTHACNSITTIKLTLQVKGCPTMHVLLESN